MTHMMIIDEITQEGGTMKIEWDSEGNIFTTDEGRKPKMETGWGSRPSSHRGKRKGTRSLTES